jgi:hypothetical protein
MINELVTFIGAQGHRYAEIAFLASCVVAPMWIVDMVDEIAGTRFTLFFQTEEDAEEAAVKYAFDGVIKEIK